MATEAVCCGEESAVVSVYVERPRRRVSSSDPNRRHGGHHHHHHKVGGGHNRRADLLLYSQQLRKAARSRLAGPMPDQHPQLATISPTTYNQDMVPALYVSLMFCWTWKFICWVGRCWRNLRVSLDEEKIEKMEVNCYICPHAN